MKKQASIIQLYCDDKKMNNFNITPFSDVTCLDMEFEETHQHEYFEIIWLESGTGIHQIDMVDHSYEGPVLFFLAPGQVHKIIQHKKSGGYTLKFLPAFFKQEKDFIDYTFDTCLLDTVKSCPVIHVPQQMTTIIQELFCRFTEEFNKQEPDADIILSSYLKILTTHARRIKNNYLSKEALANKPQYTLFRKYKIAVEQNYKTRHTVQDYAMDMQTTTRALNDVTRKFANKSALEIIQDRIILEAKRRLYHDSKSIKELGYELGFEDPAYFTRFFKKNVGLAPQNFKTGKSEMAKAAIA
jgi:AraC-like DNA-binding protein